MAIDATKCKWCTADIEPGQVDDEDVEIATQQRVADGGRRRGRGRPEMPVVLPESEPACGVGTGPAESAPAVQLAPAWRSRHGDLVQRPIPS